MLPAYLTLAIFRWLATIGYSTQPYGVWKLKMGSLRSV